MSYVHAKETEEAKHVAEGDGSGVRERSQERTSGWAR